MPGRDEFDPEAAYGLTGSVAFWADPSKYEIEVPSVYLGRRNNNAAGHLGATVVDNVVRYAEGPGIKCGWCGHDLFENNLVFMAGYPFGRSLQFQGTDTTFVTLRRNTPPCYEHN